MRCRAGLLLLLVLPSSLWAEDAILRTGQRQAGTLILDDQRHAFFQPADQTKPLPLATLREVRSTPSLAALQPAAAFTVHLLGEQTLTGQLLRYNERRLELRTAWGKLDLPLTGVTAVGPRSGWTLAATDDFEDLKGWKVGGNPTLDKPGVTLHSGDSLERAWERPLGHVRCGINFQVPEALTDTHAELFVECRQDNRKQTLAITLAGPERTQLALDAPGLKGELHAVQIRPGRHRLEVEVRPTGLRILVDAAVLWRSSERTEPLSLLGIKLQCRAAKKESRTEKVQFGAFGMEHAQASLRRPPGDSTQDELWLVPGDQLFGKLQRLDARGITLEGSFGTRSLAWSQVRSVLPLRMARQTVTLTGEHVRLGLESTLQAEPDHLEGVLQGLDATTLKLQTAWLGELTIPRAAVRTIVGLGQGRRDYERPVLK